MLGRHAKEARLPMRKMMLSAEDFDIVMPHRLLAVITVTALRNETIASNFLAG